MSKYYKAEDVINAIDDKIAEYIPTLYGRYGEIPLELRMAIEHLPTIEVSERTGEWIKNDDFTCSACGYHMIVGGGAYNYCPNCGAKMGGKEEKNSDL